MLWNHICALRTLLCCTVACLSHSSLLHSHSKPCRSFTTLQKHRCAGLRQPTLMDIWFREGVPEDVYGPNPPLPPMDSGVSASSYKLISGGSFSSPAAHYCPVCGIIATSQANLEVCSVTGPLFAPSGRRETPFTQQKVLASGGKGEEGEAECDRRVRVCCGIDSVQPEWWIGSVQGEGAIQKFR